MSIDGLVQERRNSSALAMELRLSCINPSMCPLDRYQPILPIFLKVGSVAQYCLSASETTLRNVG